MKQLQDESKTESANVTMRHIILACYAVIAVISMGIVGTFFPESAFGSRLVGGPWSIAWWVAPLVPGYILDRILQYMELRSKSGD
jgi:hypothetical protein